MTAVFYMSAVESLSIQLVFVTQITPVTKRRESQPPVLYSNYATVPSLGVRRGNALSQLVL